MHTLDLSLLERADGGLEEAAAIFEMAARVEAPLRIARHGLDDEVLELISSHGVSLLLRPEFEASLADQQREMTGIAQRLLRVASVASGRAPTHLSDLHAGDPVVALRVLVPGDRWAAAPVNGLLCLQQRGDGSLIAHMGPRLAELGGWPRWRRVRARAPEANGSLLLEFAARRSTLRSAPVSKIAAEFNTRAAVGRLPAHEARYPTP